MIIQLNTDAHISGTEELASQVAAAVNSTLGHLSQHVTRVDAEDDVGAAAGQRQLVLDQHFHRIEAGVTQVIGQDRQTVGRGTTLGLRRQLPGRMLHMVADPIGQRALPGKLDNTGHGLTERRQRTTPGQHELLVRWGHVRSPEARRSALAPSLYRVAPTISGLGTVARWQADGFCCRSPHRWVLTKRLRNPLPHVGSGVRRINEPGRGRGQC